MTNFNNIFCNNIPLLDVRAAVEFKQGSFPNATNLALLNDDQRHQVGLCYKQLGQDKAIELGHQLITGELKSQRIKQWKTYCQNNPKAQLYCFRGGMRSHLVQQWLKNEGINIHLIKGGYKAMRSYLLGILQQPLKLLRISGQTGVGKTDLLIQLNHMVDLEGLANHRGSAFGRHVSEQPSQIDFENQLAIEIIKKSQNKPKPIIIEDESRYIGSINLPKPFIQSMIDSPVILLICPQQERINRIYKDYVILQKQDYIKHHPENGGDLFNQSLTIALEKIQKRLGGVRYKHLNDTMQLALKQESEQLHKEWISDLLKFYYDPMYNYQLEKKSNQIIFKGNKQAIKDYLS